ncbi:MAG: GTP 3',8-cyclase MoaA [Actinobacteria bacterium]|nr:GTP 3',8-cyclase MoaA [Actinomycetota bacterium]
MLDSYKRKIDYLRLAVTDRCNLRCVYCMPPEGVKSKKPEEILRYEEIEFIARCAAKIGVSKVRLTGGEPLVRKGIVDLVKSLSEIPGFKDISLTTNGIFLAELAPYLSKAGLTRVNISLDSVDPEAYKNLTRGGDVNLVLKGIKAAFDCNLIPVKINVVAMKGISDDLKHFVKLTYEYPVHIRFIEYMPVGADSTWSKNTFISYKEIMKKLLSFGKLDAAESPVGAGPAVYYKFPKALGTIGFISPITNHFCTKCNRIRVTADGKLKTCLFSEREIDLIKRIREGATEDEICEVIKTALRDKPEGHKLAENKRISRGMSQIGG